MWPYFLTRLTRRAQWKFKGFKLYFQVEKLRELRRKKFRAAQGPTNHHIFCSFAVRYPTEGYKWLCLTLLFSGLVFLFPPLDIQIFDNYDVRNFPYISKKDINTSINITKTTISIGEDEFLIRLIKYFSNLIFKCNLVSLSVFPGILFIKILIDV